MKKFFATFSVFVLLIAGASVVYFRSANSQPRVLGAGSANQTPIAVRQILDGSASTAHLVRPGSTALELLTSSARIKTEGAGKMAFVTAINGHSADRNKREFWAFYVNGKQAEVGAGSYILKNGDKIEWKLENF